MANNSYGYILLSLFLLKRTHHVISKLLPHWGIICDLLNLLILYV